MKVVWTELAKVQLKATCQYYKEVAGNRVAKTIKTKIFEKTRKLSRHPEIGQQEQNTVVTGLGYRYLVSGNYKIIYKIQKEEKNVMIAAVFDTRQHPDALEV
jgi:plasmid stabilization system protein ParE